VFGIATEAALRAFQEVRGLRVDGLCEQLTWTALQEASWELGDRHLNLRAPNLRGDDVAELQRVLGQLGFDTGRVDGIYGPQSERAVRDFQDNTGLAADGVCGYETFAALRRVGGRVSDGPPIATIREQQSLRELAPRMARKRVVLGCFGGLDVITRTIGRQLRSAGASVAELDNPDGSAQAGSANRFGADVYLGLAASERCTVSYYAVPGYVSYGGRRLAQLIYEQVFALELLVARPRGMRLPVLRETRMPAVLLELGPIHAVVAHASALAEAMTSALRSWVDTPVQPS
jgi:N-acetylmuramoyl-L-alanine amidase